MNLTLGKIRDKSNKQLMDIFLKAATTIKNLDDVSRCEDMIVILKEIRTDFIYVIDYWIESVEDLDQHIKNKKQRNEMPYRNMKTFQEVVNEILQEHEP